MHHDPETRRNCPRRAEGYDFALGFAAHALPAEVRLYDHLFTVEDPGAAEDFTACLNPNSLQTLTGAMVEPSLRGAAPESKYQFERLGYFCVDPDSNPDRLVFNRTVSLRDTWAKISKKS